MESQTTATAVLLIISYTFILRTVSGFTQQEPGNITRAVGEEDVFIPCQIFEFRPTPPIWLINEKDYTSATLPSLFSQVAGGLFIGRIDACLDGYTFQCIDTSGDGLVGRRSLIGTLTVTSDPPISCPDEFFETNLIFSHITETIVLEHGKFEFGSINTTLAWKIPSEYCNISQIQSYPQCQPNNVQFERTTTSTWATLPSEVIQVPFLINISSRSDQPMMQCPKLRENLQFNMNDTENVQLLLGSNNCTCLEITCSGSRDLTVVVTNPNPTQADIICPASVVKDVMSCFNISECANFNAHNAYHPFFHICENPLDSSRCSLCFDNVTPDLSGVKLFFFYTLIRNDCGSEEHQTTAPTPTRVYFRSFHISTTMASVEITFHDREICFTSLLPIEGCNLSQLTLYNVSIVDVTQLVIFENSSLPESYCVAVGMLECGPFHVSAHPYTVNNFVVYSFVSKTIITGNENICSCLRENVEFSALDFENDTLNYTCSTTYYSPVEIFITTHFEDHSVGKRVACIDGSISVDFNSSCGGTVDVCGYWTFMNGSYFVDCPLHCTSQAVVCPEPTVSPTAPPRDLVLIISLCVAPSAVLIIVLSLLVVYFCKCARGKTASSNS